MIAIPAIYFTLLLVLVYHNKKEFDLPCYIIALLDASAILSIVIDVLNLRSEDTLYYNISAVSALTYCGLLTLCIIPIIAYRDIKISYIQPLKNDLWIKIFSVVSIIYSLFFLVMSVDTIHTIMNSDLAAMRSYMSMGEGVETWMDKLSTPARIPFSILNILYGCPWIFIFLAFFSYYVQKLPLRYAIFIFSASFIGPINSIMMIDRSNVAYWILSFIACYIFFRPIFTKKQKRIMFISSVIIIFIFAIYLSLITIARFDNRIYENDIYGPLGGIIVYLGQPYINFCFFFDNFNPTNISLQTIFPISYHVLGLTEFSVVQLLWDISDMYFMSVFYTFLGHIMITSGLPVTILYCIAFVVVAYLILHNKKMDLFYIYTYFMFASVMFLGVFTHFYAVEIKQASLITFFVIFYLSSRVSIEKR